MRSVAAAAATEAAAKWRENIRRKMKLKIAQMGRRRRGRIRAPAAKSLKTDPPMEKLNEPLLDVAAADVVSPPLPSQGGNRSLFGE